MIKVFGQLDKVYTSNGDVVLRPLKARVTKKDNGDYLLDLECGLEYIDYIVEGNIITANTPTGDQAFRIGNVTKSKWKLVSKCYHVYYDSKNYLIADSLVENRTCDFAIKHLNNATEPTSEFTVGSDITTLNSFRCVRKSLYEAIQTIIEKWGGHVVRDNYNIQIKDSIGTDNGIIVQYKKNIRDISVQENWNNVVTKLLPVGKDGLLLNYLNPSADIYITSSTQYSLPYTKTVSFSQDIDRRDFPDDISYYTALINDLRAQGTKYLAEYCVPQVNYTLKANLDRVTDIGDTIEVIDERLGINMMTKVTGFVYDCIFEKYIEVEFGNFTQTVSNLLNNINNSVNKALNIQSQTITQEVGNQIETVSENVTSVQTQANQIQAILADSYVTYDGNKIEVAESLPSDEAVNRFKLSYNGFERSDDSGETFSTVLSIDGDLILDNLAVKKNNVELTAFVLSEGTTDGWTWRKYTSGKVEAWKALEIDSADLTWASFLTLNRADAIFDYPFTINNAILSATMESCPDIGWIASATDGSIRIIREGTSGNMTVNIFIKGNM